MTTDPTHSTMNPIYSVTLSDLRKADACFDSYNKVVRMLQGEPFSEEDAERESYIKHSHNDPISLVSIARNNGINDALWALRCVPNCERDARLFAVWCARQVEHLMTDQRSKDALNVAERFANGDATEEELKAAWTAAWAEARAAAWTAAWAAARAAAWAEARAAAWTAAWAAAQAAARAAAGAASGAASGAAQLEMFERMCEGTAPWQQS